MRRTYRDGTRTLCPCPNSLAPLPDFFLFQSLFARKKRCCACSCLCSIHREQDHALPASRGKTPGSQNFRAGPAQTPFHKGRRSPSSAAQAALLPAPVRCAVPRGTTARQHKASPRNRLWYRVSGRCLCRIRQVPCPWPLPCPYCLLERRAARTNHTAPAGPADCTSS